MIAKLFSSTIAKALGGLSLALALACAALLVRGNYWHARSAKWEDLASKWKSAQRAQQAAYVAAQASAAASARAARLAVEQTSRTIAERADHEDFSTERAAVARFADARRVPVHASPVGSPTGDARAAGQADTAPGGDRSGADAVVLGRGEFDQLVGNTLRLERVRRWGQELITADLAAPADQQKDN